MKARVGYVKERGEWVAVIFEEKEIICVGCELTKEAAHTWAEQALLFHEGECAEHPADMYDRAQGSCARH